MHDFETTMALGQAEYQDVIDALGADGLPTAFTQTGGMNAALEVRLDGGYSLLVTEADDSLAWMRSEHKDWGVGLFAPDQAYDGDCLAADTTDDGSLTALRRLIAHVLQAAVR